MRLMIMILGLLASSLMAQKPTDLATLVAHLGMEGKPEQYQAYRELTRRRDPAVLSLLVKVLPGYGTTGQNYGVYVLQGLGRDRANPALRKLTKCHSPYLVLLAATNLFRAGEKEMAKRICTALSAGAPTERPLMLSRLYSVRDAAIQDLIRNWLVPGIEPNLLRSTLRFLQQAEDSRANEPVHKILATENSLASGALALCHAFLFSRGESDYAQPLADYLANAKIDYQDLTTIAAFLQSTSDLPKVLKLAICRRLETEKGVSQLRTLLDLLAAFPSPRAIPTLRQLLDHKSMTVVKPALAALFATPGGLRSSALHSLLIAQDDERAILAADMLRRLDDFNGLTRVLKIAQARGKFRAAALEALGKFRSAKAIPPLLQALDDPNQLIRQRAFTGVRTLLVSLFPYRRLDLYGAGFDPNGPAAARRLAVAKVRAWWEMNQHLAW